MTFFLPDLPRLANEITGYMSTEKMCGGGRGGASEVAEDTGIITTVVSNLRDRGRGGNSLLPGYLAPVWSEGRETLWV